MSTKAFQARVICDDETRTLLWQLTVRFDNRVNFMLAKMLDMRAGRAGSNSQMGQAYKRVFATIKNSQKSLAMMEALGNQTWSTGKLGGQVTRRGRQAQAAKDAECFLKVKDQVDAQIRTIGDWFTRKPMEWRELLRREPGILRWRSPDVVFEDLTQADMQRIEKAQNPQNPKKKKKTQAGKKSRSWEEVAVKALIKRNPELGTLDKARREYLWAFDAQQIRDADGRLFEREREFSGLANEFIRKTYESAFAIIHGHESKLADWRKRHKEWLAAKRKFEKDNRKYVAVRGRLAAFEKEVGGRISKRRRRWHLYVEFLRRNPQLAAWKDDPAEVHEIPDAGLERIRKAPPKKRRAVEAEEFFNVNPSLKALDEVHRQYEDEYIRRHAERRFLDGFSLPPTFTVPSLPLHPCWFSFKKKDTYKDLEIRQDGKHSIGSFKAMIPWKSNGSRVYKWVRIVFRGSPKLSHLTRAKAVAKVGKDNFTWVYRDPKAKYAGDRERCAEVKGIRLMFRPATSSGVPYVVFAVSFPDRPISDRARQLKDSRNVPEGFVSCAADAVMRHPHLAAVSITVATRSEDGNLYPRIVRQGFISASEVAGETDSDRRSRFGPSIKHQAIHKIQLKRARSGSRGIKGQGRNRQLQRHVTNMGEDASRKAARKLVDFALRGVNSESADVLVVENLKALRADAARERGLNTALINWRRGHTTRWAKQFAADSGVDFREVKSYWTSQVCSRCLSLGRRYTPVFVKAACRYEPRFGPVEKLFACPRKGCQIDANADLNASANLHYVLYNRFPDVKKKGDRIVVNGESTTYREVEQAVTERLRSYSKSFKVAAQENPF